jgi:hypothetical protein
MIILLMLLGACHAGAGKRVDSASRAVVRVQPAANSAGAAEACCVGLEGQLQDDRRRPQSMRSGDVWGCTAWCCCVVAAGCGRPRAFSVRLCVYVGGGNEFIGHFCR